MVNSDGFLGGSEGKESICNAGDPDLIPGSKRSPGEGNGNLLQYSCLENSMDRSLAGSSPCSRKKLHRTEQLTLSLSDGKAQQGIYLSWLGF